MPELRIQIDPLNPGLCLACFGLIDLFDLDGAQVLSRFEWDTRRPRNAEFILQSHSALNLGSVGSNLRASNVKAVHHEDPNIAPISMTYNSHSEIILDWWLDCFHQEANHDFKLWGKQTTLKTVNALIAGLQGSDDLFHQATMMTTRFGLDPRPAWTPLDLGYSPNVHTHKESLTYPGVELLAAIGLQGFRVFGRREQGFVCGLWRCFLPRSVSRLVCGNPYKGLPVERVRFDVKKRGQSAKYFGFGERIGHDDR